jgi:antitoxin ParD1/3/4
VLTALVCLTKIPNIGILGGLSNEQKHEYSLGKHFDAFIAEQLKAGRYASTSEIVRAGLRLLEEEETKLATLRQMLDEGESSNFVEYSLQGLIEELDNKTH